jgi:hypothetical protein
MAHEERKFRWLRAAFTIQVVVLVLMVAVLAFVSWQFDSKQSQLIDSNVKLANRLQAKEKLLDQQQSDFVVLATQAAFELRNANKPELADQELSNALLADPGSWLAWRDEAMAMIDEHQAPETLDRMMKAPIDKSDGHNLLTEAMLQCAAGQYAAGRDLLAQALQTADKPAAAELRDLNKLCQTR